MAKPIPIEAIPPGDILKDELEERGWTQADFAEIIGRDPKAVSMLISGKTRITEETAQLLENALDVDAQFWLNLESSYRLALRRNIAIPDTVSRRAKLYQKFPVNSMIKKGWITATTNIDVLQHQLFSFFNISDMSETPHLIYAAKKVYKENKTPIQLAWLFRSYQMAKALPVRGFSAKKLEGTLQNLKLLLKDPEEIRHVPRLLAESGIRFVVVEPIPGSGIDGACYWIDSNSPVVAMSLRHDRIDNFWFVLLHELRHVANEHGKDDEILDIEMEKPQELNDEEILVNKEAAAFLAPELDDFISRVKPIFSTISVLGFAHRTQVHPGIVVGQLQHRGLIPQANHNKFKVKIRQIICSTALCDGWGITPKIGRQPT